MRNFAAIVALVLVVGAADLARSAHDRDVTIRSNCRAINRENVALRSILYSARDQDPSGDASGFYSSSIALLRPLDCG